MIDEIPPHLYESIASSGENNVVTKLRLEKAA